MEDGIAILQQAVKERGLHGSYKDLGEISTATQGEYILFNYTPKATYARRWNAVERVSRGLILHRDGRVVARPFSKFFNLGEMGMTIEALADKPGPIEITEKMDGSLGIIWWCQEQERWRVSTRGSFHSDQARWAQSHIDYLYHERKRYWPRHWTLLCEIIYPGSRVVIPYQTSGLVLIGVIDLLKGGDLLHKDLMRLYGMPPVVPAYKGSLESLFIKAAIVANVEGWVLRWPDGTRVKLKTAEYRRLHKLVTGVTPARVLDALICDQLDVWLTSIPEEYRGEIETIANQIEQALLERSTNVHRHFRRLAYLLAESRRDYALAVQREAPEYASELFALADGKGIRAMMLKKLDLSVVCCDDKAS